MGWAVGRPAAPATARLCRFLLACWAALVGLTRIHLGMHWPTDLLGGWLYALTRLTAAMAVYTVAYGVRCPGRPPDEDRCGEHGTRRPGSRPARQARDTSALRRP
ncbi:phosphatase PAP2 family protein [Streptomyces sp. NPDC051578]|uniref:phosphatase PAP2 family protein n=1 Tax=Streptomyces sp. NPDC051578 TaxID=3365662 RepID=UPI003787F00C